MLRFSRGHCLLYCFYGVVREAEVTVYSMTMTSFCRLSVLGKFTRPFLAVKMCRLGKFTTVIMSISICHAETFIFMRSLLFVHAIMRCLIRMTC
uniref:Uncharacterized protein n=1 Tax=Oryza punctata TaxID=4537 RepID=A0A0E0JYG7_ORYPU